MFDTDSQLFKIARIYRVFQKTDPLVYFDDNFSKYGPVLTIFSVLQQEIYDAEKLRHFSHLIKVRWLK